jgi:hypothetical protein
MGEAFGFSANAAGAMAGVVAASDPIYSNTTKLSLCRTIPSPSNGSIGPFRFCPFLTIPAVWRTALARKVAF